MSGSTANVDAALTRQPLRFPRMDGELAVTTLSLADDAYVVTARGELDLYAVDELRDALERILEAGARNLVVDVLDVSFLDSTALGLLLEFAGRIRSRGGTLLLVTDNPHVRRLLQVTGLESRFELRRSLAHAVTEVADVAGTA